MIWSIFNITSSGKIYEEWSLTDLRAIRDRYIMDSKVLDEKIFAKFTFFIGDFAK